MLALIDPKGAEAWLPVLKDYASWIISGVMIPVLTYLGLRHGQQNKAIEKKMDAVQTTLNGGPKVTVVTPTVPVAPVVTQEPVTPAASDSPRCAVP